MAGVFYSPMLASLPGFLAFLILFAATGLASGEDTPAPASGVIVGNWIPAEDGRPMLEQAVALASARAGHPVMLIVNPKGRTRSADDQAELFASQWPGRTILVVNISDGLEVTGGFHPANEVKDRFDAAAIQRIKTEVAGALQHGRFNFVMVQVVREIGARSGGQAFVKWDPWKHPYRALTGGEDATDEERLDKVVTGGFLLALLILALAWLKMFLGDPKAALLNLFIFVAEGLLGAVVSGGSGGGGGGMSGGGGSFDGGGATGSW